METSVPVTVVIVNTTLLVSGFKESVRMMGIVRTGTKVHFANSVSMISFINDKNKIRSDTPIFKQFLQT
jgi:hypothetical protein